LHFITEFSVHEFESPIQLANSVARFQGTCFKSKAASLAKKSQNYVQINPPYYEKCLGPDTVMVITEVVGVA